MQQMSKRLLLLSCLILTVLVLISCGGGGGAAPTPESPQQELNRNNAAPVSGTVITGIRLIINPSYTGTISASADSLQTKNRAQSFLLSLFNKAADHIRSSNNILRTTQGAIDRTTNCTGGGMRKEVSQWTGNETDPQNYTGTITYTNCKEGTEIWNGSAAITYQGSSQTPIRVTTTLNSMTYIDTAADTNLTLTGMTIVYADITYNSNLEVLSASTAMSGTITGTLYGKGINAVFDDLKMAYSFQGSGLNIQMSGKIKPACLNKWLIIETPVTVSMNIAGKCPSGGELAIIDGAVAVRMLFNTQGGLTVLFNNETAATYTDCSEAAGLCK